MLRALVIDLWLQVRNFEFLLMHVNSSTSCDQMIICIFRVKNSVFSALARLWKRACIFSSFFLFLSVITTLVAAVKDVLCFLFAWEKIPDSYTFLVPFVFIAHAWASFHSFNCRVKKLFKLAMNAIKVLLLFRLGHSIGVVLFYVGCCFRFYA